MKTILLIITIIFMSVSYNVPKPSDAESICIMAGNSAKEIIFMNAVIHDGRVFPLEGKKRDGCLLLHDYYMFDLDGDGIRDKGFVFGEFVEDSRDHCCTLGY